MKILVSWLAYNNDFVDGKATIDAPNYQFHKHFYAHERHYILSAQQSDDTRLKHLVNLLSSDFPDHSIEEVYLDIADVIDINSIRSKIEPFLQLHHVDEVEVFISPGTPAMQVVWYLTKLHFRSDLALVQVRQARFTKDRSAPELIRIDLESSPVPYSAIVRQLEVGKTTDEILKVESLKPVYDIARQVAAADGVTALILGESGTGKENLARSIHKDSARSHRPYLTLNCSAFSDNLLESRLFGYVKGAFTGAEKNTLGLLEEANGGTVFLDEIGDISLMMQQSLLRVLQEKEITPIGGKPKKIDVRIIAATNKNLTQLCTEDKFRWDLYYRLAVVELELPALINWKENELKLLINFFSNVKAAKFGRNKLLAIDSEVMSKLLSYNFPGNIRELENLMERFYVLCKDSVTVRDIPSRFLSPHSSQPIAWDDVEKEHIRKMLTLYRGNQQMVAEKIGWAVNTLKAKMKKYEFELNQFRN